MSSSEAILRVAARGDGVTESGRHIAFTAPGDVVDGKGAITPGPHRAIPPCRHFGRCGGCQLQHLDESSLAAFVADRVTIAALSQHLAPERVAQARLSPPRSRRRATLHAQAFGRKVVLGFTAMQSHKIVDMQECHVIAPALFGLVGPLRGLLAEHGGRSMAAEVAMTLCDQGVDLGIKGLAIEGLAATEAILGFAREHQLARLSIDAGYGAETLWEPDPVTVTLSGVPVGFPPGAFLQATLDGEAALAAAIVEWLGGTPAVADLFAGLGTFAFALAPRSRVLAVEAARDTHLACKTAAGGSGGRVHALHRDLFRNPLQAEELDRFGAVVLDPPRAGAREQVALLAASKVPRIAYVSCNPATWARDAALLVRGGYRLVEVRPIGQFRWSTHVELASLFVNQS